jgi:hypothetical protein
MNLAALTLAALIVALILSMGTSVNVGLVALVMAWLVGVYAGGLRVEQVPRWLSGGSVPDAGRDHAALRTGAG